jgi:hypothetical protein
MASPSLRFALDSHARRQANIFQARTSLFASAWLPYLATLDAQYAWSSQFQHLVPEAAWQPRKRGAPIGCTCSTASFLLDYSLVAGVKEPVHSPLGLVFSSHKPGCDAEQGARLMDTLSTENDDGHTSSQYNDSHNWADDSQDVSAAVERYSIYDPTRPLPIIPGQPNAEPFEEGDLDADDSDDESYDGESSKGESSLHEDDEETRMDEVCW